MQRSKTICAIILIVTCAGCSEQAEVREYTIPKSDESAATTDAMRRLIAQRASQMRTPTASTAPPVLPDFKMPDGWTPAALDQFSLAAFTVGSGDASARVTISATNAGTGLKVNLNRWRGQVGLPDASDDELAAGASRMKMGDDDSIFVEYVGPDGEAIVGAVAVQGERLWSFKMRGPTAVVAEHTSSMKSFCESVRFKGG